MSLLVHMAPRVLRIGDLWGEWISPCNSILQGCGSSNSLAGALLHRLLQDLHSRFPVQIGQQVDDINHHSPGTFLQALHWSVEATCMLDRGLTSLGLTLSQNKSVVVASLPQLLRPFGVSCWSKGYLLKGLLLCVTWVLTRMLRTEDQSRFKKTRGSKSAAKETPTSR